MRNIMYSMCNIAHLKNFRIKSGDCATKPTLKCTLHTHISEQFECALTKIVCKISFLYSIAYLKNCYIEIMSINVVGHTFKIALQYDTEYWNKSGNKQTFKCTLKDRNDPSCSLTLIDAYTQY